MRGRWYVATVLAGALSLPVHAQFEGPSAAARATTVAQATSSARVGSNVTLTGNIVESLREDYFTFKDATGSIRVEISPKDFRGQRVTPTTTVRITGEVERGFAGRYIDVDLLEVLASN
ncbi:NirD/YgiW/YdeI family stress tolerance protein [Variovorax sp. J2P1-59]|uniref:YgiW/YdeI family stress tolerance OB fold protein n=1 Tax=Variovorax flavidus TaxID=3053501 RepID=UPI0025789F5C|nr:NirD/YgiW/YdeI family stress tolerance protein [Variovorax sp. J2P1-59]MDM0076322.1 NirD/YgiW/YdeI family stress tolerance protein [Variovorax sp. J2P1-59]